MGKRKLSGDYGDDNGLPRLKNDYSPCTSFCPEFKRVTRGTLVVLIIKKQVLITNRQRE